jgi:hypothetical protein
MASRPRHVGSSPQSSHSSARVARPLSAISRLPDGALLPARRGRLSALDMNDVVDVLEAWEAIEV